MEVDYDTIVKLLGELYIKSHLERVRLIQQYEQQIQNLKNDRLSNRQDNSGRNTAS